MKENEKDWTEYDEHNDLTSEQTTNNYDKIVALWASARIRMFDHINGVLENAFATGGYDDVVKAVEHCENLIDIIDRMDKKFGFANPDDENA